MLSLKLLFLVQLKFLLNVFILIVYQTVFTASPACFIHVYKPTKWGRPRLKNGKMIIAESFRAVGGASDLLHDFVQVWGCEFKPHILYIFRWDGSCLYLYVILTG